VDLREVADFVVFDRMEPRGLPRGVLMNTAPVLPEQQWPRKVNKSSKVYASGLSRINYLEHCTSQDE